MKILLLSALFIIFISQSALSVELKKSNGLLIKSQDSIIDFKKGVNTYKNNVVITTNEFELKADKVIEFKENNITIKAEAYGSPVKFKQFNASGKKLMFGDARKAYYYRLENKVILFNYTLTNENGDRMIGQKGDFILESLLTNY